MDSVSKSILMASGGVSGPPPAPPGQIEYTTPGTYSWTVPTGVTSICIVAVGAGGNGDRNYNGAGGALAWTNAVLVTPGETLSVRAAANAQSSYVKRGATSLCEAGFGGNGGTSGDGGIVIVGTGGGSGGAGAIQAGGARGGGGAGGYTGNGGPNGGTGDGAGGGGGAGGIKGEGQNSTYYYAGQAGGGGGVGILGQGASGVGGAYPGGGTGSLSGAGGSGGSGGGSGLQSTVTGVSGLGTAPDGGAYGGGGGSGGVRIRLTTGAELIYPSGVGATGAVRIIWGTGRSFPSTNTGNV